MIDPTEAAFLRGIAAEGDADTGRLAYADWLDENGHADRAEFVRVQCELAARPTDALRERERALLDAHRAAWVKALGLPIEDVWFERGLVSRVRLPEWDAGILEPQFATLTELDLSDVPVGDAGVSALATGGQFPLLRKLILSNTGTTDTGAKALAAATGLPRLDTLYLFANTISPGAVSALKKRRTFKLKTLDVGERPDSYSYTAGEAEVARRAWIRTHLQPCVNTYFKKYKRLQSAMLCVAQYWADEAEDAVHDRLIVSELSEPVMKGVNQYGAKGVRDANLPKTRIKSRYDEGSSSVVGMWESGVPWDDNNGAIPLWAAFAPEGGTQEYGELEEAYAPAVMFYRHGGYEVLPMQRPHLDGVRPEWGAEE